MANDLMSVWNVAMNSVVNSLIGPGGVSGVYVTNIIGKKQGVSSGPVVTAF